MNKTLLATSIALSLGITAPSVNAAFTSLSAGDYTMNITSGCYTWGNCQSGDGDAFTDNTTDQATTYVKSAGDFSGTFPYGPTVTTRPLGATIGSGIAGDGLMGIINFAIDASGNMTINSFNQDSYLGTGGGDLYLDALGAGDTSAMTGHIGLDGAMTFTPAGREGLFSIAATTIGVQAFNRDKVSGLYDTFTTTTSTNRNKGPSPSFTLTGTALSDDGFGGWAGTLVSAGNLNGDNWTGLSNVQYSEVWDISITAVPVPAAVWLFGSGLLGLIGVARPKKA